MGHSVPAGQGAHPRGELRGVFGPGLEVPRARGSGKGCELAGIFQEAAERMGETGGVHGIKRETAATMRGFSEGTEARANAGLAVMQALQRALPASPSHSA